MTKITKDTKIYLAGHKGMVGSACWRLIEKKGYKNLIGKPSKELDLKDQQAITKFFNEIKPQIVIDAAAKVGGIWDKSKPEDTPRKLTDSANCNKIGWNSLKDLKSGIRKILI